MSSIPQTSYDVTFNSLQELRLMPRCSKLLLGWQTNSEGTYYITQSENGRVRCQHWTSKTAKGEFVKALQLVDYALSSPDVDSPCEPYPRIKKLKTLLREAHDAGYSPTCLLLLMQKGNYEN
jgi:hypothetical protein